MVNLPAQPEPTPTAVHHDRKRVRYAVLGALALVGGVWIAWIASQLFGWSLGDLGISPREPAGLLGILTAPFADTPRVL